MPDYARDQTVVLTSFYSAQHCPDKLRRIKYYYATTEKRLVFLINNFSLSGLTITENGLFLDHTGRYVHGQQQAERCRQRSTGRNES